MNQLSKRDNPVDSNRDAIELFLVSDEGTVELNEVQKKLLERWSYADEQIRKNEMRRETIAKLIMRKFDVKRTTAYQDIVNAENVFSSSTPLNKRYRVQLRIEFLEMKINELYGMVEPDPQDPQEEDILERVSRIQSNKEYYQEAIALEKHLATYYKMYPDIIPKRSPKTIIFQVIGERLPKTNMTVEEALKADGPVTDLTQNKDGTFE